MMEVDFSDKIKELAKNSKKDSTSSVSDRLSDLLNYKADLHNEDNEQEITACQLKKVYRRGSAVYAHSHLVNKTRGQLALARVNNFIKLAEGKDTDDNYRLVDKDILDGEETYYIEVASKAFVGFTDLELDLACLELIKAGVEKWDQDIDCFDLEYTKEEKKTIGKPFKFASESSDEFGVFVKNANNGKTVLVRFENRPVKASSQELSATDSLYWSAKFWKKRALSESVSSDAVEWDDKEVVTQWYWDDSSFLEYEDIFSLNPELVSFIDPEHISE